MVKLKIDFIFNNRWYLVIKNIHATEKELEFFETFLLNSFKQREFLYMIHNAIIEKAKHHNPYLDIELMTDFDVIDYQHFFNTKLTKAEVYTGTNDGHNKRYNILPYVQMKQN